MTKRHNDILGKLKRARDVQEIEALLGEAEMFTGATDNTRRRQQRFADRRRQELEDEK